MSRGIFASIDSGAGLPANGLTVILVSRSDCHSPSGGTNSSSAKKKRTLLGCASAEAGDCYFQGLTVWSLTRKVATSVPCSTRAIPAAVLLAGQPHARYVGWAG